MHSTYINPQNLDLDADLKTYHSFVSSDTGTEIAQNIGVSVAMAGTRVIEMYYAMLINVCRDMVIDSKSILLAIILLHF
jgi:hypothetical protein